MQNTSTKAITKKKTIKIGRPGYKIFKVIDPQTGQKKITFELDYEQIDPLWKPFYRIMSSFEQKVEPHDRNYQYIIFAAEPYDNIGFKIPNNEIEEDESLFYSEWNKEKKKFTLHLAFR